MKTVLVVTSSYPRYVNDTAGIFIHNLNVQLSRHYKIIVLAPYSKGLKKEEEIDGIKIVRFKQFPIFNFGFGNSDYGMFELIKKRPYYLIFLFTYYIYLFLNIKQLLKKEKIDLIHFHWLLPNSVIIIFLSLIRVNVKTATTIHGSDYWAFNNKVIKNAKFFLMERMSKVITVSNAIKKDILGNKPFKDDFIQVIPMGVDTQRFRLKLINYQSKPQYSLLFVGKGNKSKGFDVLIESMIILKKLNYNISLVAITQSIDNDLLNSLDSNFLNDFIKFTGRIPNIKTVDYYNNSDIFVLPSLSEGWPVVVMEALSCGCICIVTDIPVFEEYKDKYEFLHVVEKSDPQALADKILQIFNNYDYYKKFKAAAREFAVNNFDWNIIAKKYLNVFEEVLNEKN